MSEELITKKIELENLDEAFVLFGNADINLKVLEDELDVAIVTRGETMNISGITSDVDLAEETIKQLACRLEKAYILESAMLNMLLIWPSRIKSNISLNYLMKKLPVIQKEKLYGLKH